MSQEKIIPLIFCFALSHLAIHAQSVTIPDLPKVSNRSFLDYIGLSDKETPLSLFPLTDGQKDISSEFVIWLKIQRKYLNAASEEKIKNELLKILAEGSEIEFVMLAFASGGTSKHSLFINICSDALSDDKKKNAIIGYGVYVSLNGGEIVSNKTQKLAIKFAEKLNSLGFFNRSERLERLDWNIIRSALYENDPVFKE